MLMLLKKKINVEEILQATANNYNMKVTASQNHVVGTFCWYLYFFKDGWVKLCPDIVWMYYWMSVMSNEGAVNDETMKSRCLSYLHMLTNDLV